MLQCTAVTELPVMKALLLLRAFGENADQLWTDDFVLCELGESHDGEHGDLIAVRDDDESVGLWLLWGEGGSRMEWLPWCDAECDQGDTCGRFLGHGAGHAWEVIDPTREALRAVTHNRWLPDE